MKEYASPEWSEIGIVVDEESGIAALVGITSGGGKPLPSVQFGRIIGPERRFSPYLHPAVNWKEGKGSIANPERIGVIPLALQEKIARLLGPHLVERPGKGLDQLVGHEILDIDRNVSGEAVLGCLSCS